MAETFTLTNAQARRFMLRWQGLAGPYRFAGAPGVVEFVRQAGCLQFDPVDVCGKNAEIVLFSRVRNFKKPALERVLYKDRALVDHWDKNMSLYPVEDWPRFARNRAWFNGWRFLEGLRDDLEPALAAARATLAEKGVACTKDLDPGPKIRWPWGQANAAKAAMEYMFYTGETGVHHRQGAVRHYAFTHTLLPPHLADAPDPCPNDADFFAWQVGRRIGAVGLLWNRPTDALLALIDCKGANREAAFERLLAEDAILECAVEGVPQPLYAPAAARPLLNEILAREGYAPRCEFIAPLDSLIWDRKLIKALFNFDYTWEIYTPVVKRKYGHYVLPVLDGESFAGRIELRCDRKAGTLAVHHYWPEPDKKPRRGFGTRLERQIVRFAAFNGCETVAYLDGCGAPGA